MKSFKNYVILSVALIMVLLVIMAHGVQASPTLIFGNNTAGTNTSGTTTTGNTALVGADTNTSGVNGVTNTTPPLNTTTNVAVSNITPTKDPATVNVTNTTPKNTTNTNTTNGNGKLPQTGENDIYIVTGIGLVALVIGGVAYMKSRKYDM
ncbi:MAG: LPXTG cell wall anchor domain-containing protein [Clostridia bacterium]|nr:LPXTG cell wall anchor domain-containing protein [Clostridia bacterium]